MKSCLRACKSISCARRHYLVASASESVLQGCRASSGSGGWGDTENDRRLSWSMAKSYAAVLNVHPHFKEGM